MTEDELRELADELNTMYRWEWICEVMEIPADVLVTTSEARAA